MRREIVSAVAAGALVTSVLTGCSLEKVARQVPGGREAVPTAAPLPELPKQLDLSPTNRRAPVDGLPD